MKRIPLTGRYGKGRFALIDNEDYELITRSTWTANNMGYSYATINKTKTYMHKLILGVSRGQMCDHINMNRIDNRRKNLRIVDASTNLANRKKFKGNYASKYKGVLTYYRPNSDKKWLARIWHKNRSIYLGVYVTEKEAARAYNKAMISIYGPQMALNKITR